MVSKTYIAFPGSERAAPAATLVGAVSPQEQIEVSVYLKPRQALAAALDEADPRGELRARRAVEHADDIRLLTEFAHDTGLTVVSVDPGRRLVKLAGPAAKLEAAFRTKLDHYNDGQRGYRGRSGPLHLPDDLAPVVEAVLGLDTRPAAQPRIVPHRKAASFPGYLPNQVGALYDFPTSVTGAGQCIALIELGGGFTPSDTQAAFQAMGLAPPTVLAVSVDGAVNQPTPDNGADGEVALDIQVAGGVAPGATIAVYFAPNTDAGFVDAVTTAAHDAGNKPSVLSISWGSAESGWTAQSLQAMTSAFQDAASLGVSTFVASGDNLATDSVNDGKAHVDFPASSPWAFGCGGTAITTSGGALTGEQVWNDGNSGSGGGISDVYPVPGFQQNAGLPASVNDGHAGRGAPDVAGDAAPGTGYTIVVNGQTTVVGGTSAVAPLWAGLTALINQQAAKPVGFYLPTLYENPGLLRDVTVGNNMPSGTELGYSAKAGWDPCTGLGSPNGAALFSALTAAAPQPAPPAGSGGPPQAGPVGLGGPAPAPAPAPAQPGPAADQLGAVNHIVVLMLENRSFDHMLGFLYADNSNVAPGGQPFEGLTGEEHNLDATGAPVSVFKISTSTPNSYFMPGADPGEGYSATNAQLFGANAAPTPPTPTNGGFVTDFAYTLGWEGKSKGWSVLPGTTASDIMGVFTPEMLPVLSGLARGFAVCDHWYGSAPTETMPNRAFACAATSQGHMDDKTKKFTAPSIFGLLSQHNLSWSIYGYSASPLTRLDFPDTTNADESHFGLFTDFQAAAANGSLASYVFLEPSWEATGNSQHPNYNVALGEQLIHDVYTALRNGPAWNQTLLVVTYDEHGGCYDHVAPPGGATPPDNSAGEYGFDFTRFGPRVPAVLVSPLIPAGSVYRAPAGGPPLDHTSILKTVQRRWGLPALTARDAAASDFGGAVSLTAPRTDDPLAGVTAPSFTAYNPAFEHPSHLLQLHAELVSELPVPDAAGGLHHDMPALKTEKDYKRYIQERTEAWKASRALPG